MNITLINKKNFIILGFFILLLSSLTITFIYENHISDGISILVSVMSIVALCFLALINLFDTILDVFNP